MKIRIKISDLRKMVVLMLILVSLIFATSISVFSNNNVTTDTVYNLYTVKTNDTLWSIAATYSKNNTDIRKIIYDIQKTNKIGDTICVGDSLLIPDINL